MEPMKPMAPMKPMQPMAKAEAWWPKGLGQPSSSGSQDGMRYAFFPDERRLVVEHGGETRTYDSGDHRINGVQQTNGGSATFSDETGTVDLADLKPVD